MEHPKKQVTIVRRIADPEMGQDTKLLSVRQLPEKERSRTDLKRLIKDYKAGATEEQLLCAYTNTMDNVWRKG